MNDENEKNKSETLTNEEKALRRQEAIKKMATLEKKPIQTLTKSKSDGSDIGNFIIGSLVIVAFIVFLIFAYTNDSDKDTIANRKSDPVQECVNAAQSGKDFSEQLNDEQQLQQECDDLYNDQTTSSDDLQSYISTVDANNKLNDMQQYGSLITSINESNTKITIDTYNQVGSYNVVAKGLCKIVADYLKENSKDKAIEILDSDGNIFVSAATPYSQCI